MDSEYQFDSFGGMLEKFEREGFRVERVGESGAVVFNDGVESEYVVFDNFVATVAFENGFEYVVGSNISEVYEATVFGGDDASEYTVYMGVAENELEVLFDSGEYSFCRERSG